MAADPRLAVGIALNCRSSHRKSPTQIASKKATGDVSSPQCHKSFVKQFQYTEGWVIGSWSKKMPKARMSMAMKATSLAGLSLSKDMHVLIIDCQLIVLCPG